MKSTDESKAARIAEANANIRAFVWIGDVLVVLFIVGGVVATFLGLMEKLG
jgi:hypothetical protein